MTASRGATRRSSRRSSPTLQRRRGPWTCRPTGGLPATARRRALHRHRARLGGACSALSASADERYGALMPGDDAEVLEVDGREVRLSSPGKVLFAERGETKRDLVDYYLRVGEPLLRTMGGRPVLMQRFPKGAGGPSFFQKRVPENAPEWLQTTTVTTVNGTPSRALVIGDTAHVAWAVNLGCLGFHVWPYRAADPKHCDELRLDLDPQPGTDFEGV